MAEGEEFGLMTGALKACETDPLAYSYTSEMLMPFFKACAAGHANVEALLSNTSGLTEAQAQGILASPLFRQAMLFIAITTDNTPLALDILELGPFTIPSEDLWILHERSRGWSSDDKIKKFQMWFGLRLFDMAMLSAIWEVNPELMRPSGSVDLCESSIEGGTPEILQHLWDLYGVSESDRHLDNEMIVQAVRTRQSGGIRMLEYLLDRGLDINYRTVTDSDEEPIDDEDPNKVIAENMKKKRWLYTMKDIKNAFTHFLFNARRSHQRPPQVRSFRWLVSCHYAPEGYQDVRAPWRMLVRLYCYDLAKELKDEKDGWSMKSWRDQSPKFSSELFDRTESDNAPPEITCGRRYVFSLVAPEVNRSFVGDWLAVVYI
ncbi:hypothetical protein TrVFT333_010493 [Trichoderma virens FT-333]|nr:hypothetical protein TrVFT333_010493 [Trichoderma virens FT-333]